MKYRCLYFCWIISDAVMALVDSAIVSTTPVTPFIKLSCEIMQSACDFGFSVVIFCYGPLPVFGIYLSFEEPVD